MSKSRQYAVPAVVLAFLLALGAFLVLPSLLSTDPPPSPAGRWVAEGPTDAQLELLEGGRLGRSSAIPASACEDPGSPSTASAVKVTEGAWRYRQDPESEHLVTVSIQWPLRCTLTFVNHLTDSGKHVLRSTGASNSFDLVRP
ncbi:hypothetical protein [Kitasatospora sp. NPDC057595]|uniref:hypothetical protein n=1 Tax=Kitasatospora sp. NPDC057595 TaxID=3346177 RepID=UPI0036B9A220